MNQITCNFCQALNTLDSLLHPGNRNETPRLPGLVSVFEEGESATSKGTTSPLERALPLGRSLRLHSHTQGHEGSRAEREATEVVSHWLDHPAPVPTGLFYGLLFHSQ